MRELRKAWHHAPGTVIAAVLWVATLVALLVYWQYTNPNPMQIVSSLVIYLAVSVILGKAGAVVDELVDWRRWNKAE